MPDRQGEGRMGIVSFLVYSPRLLFALGPTLVLAIVIVIVTDGLYLQTQRLGEGDGPIDYVKDN
jgi:hypothetical protein